jgi:hypothetical protein
MMTCSRKETKTQKAAAKIQHHLYNQRTFHQRIDIFSTINDIPGKLASRDLDLQCHENADK